MWTLSPPVSSPLSLCLSPETLLTAALPGGTVVYPCIHDYPHTSEAHVAGLRKSLKGEDMIMLQVLDNLAKVAHVYAVMEDKISYPLTTTTWKQWKKETPTSAGLSWEGPISSTSPEARPPSSRSCRKSILHCRTAQSFALSRRGGSAAVRPRGVCTPNQTLCLRR